MKRFSKFFSLIMALVLCTACASGCHGAKKQTAFAVPESFDTSRNYEVTFWAKNDTNKNQVAVYDNAAAKFHEKYPNITVNIRYYTDYNTIYQDVITNIATQTTPDVCITYPDHIATYITGNEVVVPLDTLMEDPKYGLGGSELKFTSPSKDKFIPEFLNEGYIDGSCYELPFMRSTEALYINKTYVEKLGYTLPEVVSWDFIWEVSEKAAEKGSDGKFLLNGDTVMIPFIYKSTDNMMIQLLKQMEGDYSDENGNIKIFNDTTTEILKTVAAHTATGAFSTFKISGYPANFLNAGQSVFAIDSTAGATWMGTDAPLSDIGKDRTVDYEIAVRPVPQINPESPSMISQGPSICVFNKTDPQQVLASWLFAQYLVSDEVQTAYAETEGYIPVTQSAQQSKEYTEYLSQAGADNDVHYFVKIEAVEMLKKYQSATFITPVFNGSASLRTAAGDMIERVAKSARRKETIDDKYIKDMYADIPAKFHFDTANAE